ncbi:MULTISPECIES: TetR/AcrR family transcriptional regulator [Thiomicrorhabdus]|uniref:TetR/AcrR family transcriptional regulator n=1 Tax=Thiomicrorhabdus heinhorstiae TaxID=2748010 RepID=A0ABS0BY35_9GAMM|nr:MULTISPECIES: TetR/AcrR family transcriptional regulator [Thiomicrorhabdus]MBF6058708.1 TetR/AcrR family transcriptional regulator [Thiomicrorhabdus heinhorstiae]
MSKYHHGDLKSGLIREAVQLLQEGKSFSLRGLSSGLSVSPAAVYRHFPNKDALLMAVAIEGFELLQQRFQSIEKDDPKERLKELGIVYVDFALQFPGHYRVMFGEFQCEPEQEELLGETGRATFSALMNACSDLADTEEVAKVMAASAWSLVHGYALLRMQRHLSAFGEPVPSIEEVLDQFWTSVTA